MSSPTPHSDSEIGKLLAEIYSILIRTAAESSQKKDESPGPTGDSTVEVNHTRKSNGGTTTYA